MTTKQALRKGRLSAKAHGLKALTDEGPGIYEAIVSVFGNVDYQGDRIIAGAFEKSLERWGSSGDPIPVVFSHQWDNPDAHVGEVLEAKELRPGAPELTGTGLEANGGLWTKFELYVDDPDEAAARRLAKRLDRRTIREFSFAYDVLEDRNGSDGATELLELDVIEVGPTLKGANPATRLLSKTLGDDWEELDEDAVLDRLAKAVADRADEKARVPVSFEGSIEDELEAIFAAGMEWARGLDVGEGGFYALHQEATYPAELRAIVLVEGWDDPIGEGVFYELTLERDDAGELSVGEAAELEIAVEVTPKARSLKHRSAGRKIELDPAGKSKGKAQAEDPGTRTTSGDEAIRLDLEIADLELSTPHP